MNIIIITGAAGGIGREYVKKMLKEKGIDEIWAVGRTESKLVKLAEEFGSKVVPVTCDVTKDEDLLAVQDLLKKKNPRVKWLINCAGTRALYKHDVPLPRMLAPIRTNAVGNMAMCYMCIPYMGKGDHILNVSSEASLLAIPSNNNYSASKVALRFFSKGLEYELKPKGIKVTCCCPGWVDTPLIDFPADEYASISKFPGMVKPEKVARTSLKDARKGKSLTFPTERVHMNYYLCKFLPTWMPIWYGMHVEANEYKKFKKSGILS